MGGPRLIVRRLRDAMHTMRFRLWVLHLRIELARRGARLKVDAPYGAELERFPIVRVRLEGRTGGTFILRVGKGVRIGRNVAVGVRADGTNELELGDYSRLYDGVRLELNAGSIVLGRHASVRYNTVLKSAGALRLGDEVFVSHGGVVHCDDRVEFGDRSGLAEGVTVVDSDHPLDGSDEHFYHRPLLVDPVMLEENVFVASRAVIMRGVDIGRNSAVGAGAVVRAGTYPAGWLIAGVPAKPIRRLDRLDSGPPPATA